MLNKSNKQLSKCPLKERNMVELECAKDVLKPNQTDATTAANVTYAY